MEDPIIGDLKQDVDGEVYIYAGEAGWRRVVTPEKRWNDLTDDEIWATYDAYSSNLEFARGVIAIFKEKNK